MLLALAVACESNPASSDATGFAVRFPVSNRLVAPVTISVDGVPSVVLQGGGSGNLTVSSTAQWLTWVSAKAVDSRGQLIPDDIGEVRISVSGINRLLEISNVINDQPYITATIFNYAKVPVSIGVYDGSSVSCAAALPGASSTSRGITQIGYYKLLLATEVRAYRDPSNCTGPFVAWSSAQIRAFNDKSGLVYLTLDTAP